MPTSFLAPLPGNGSNTKSRIRSAVYLSAHPHGVLLLLIRQFHPASIWNGHHPTIPPLYDGYEISPSLVNHGSRIVLLYEKGQESLLEFNNIRLEPKHLTVKLSLFSLTGEAKIWYDQTAGRVGGDWIKLKDEFSFPTTKVFALGTA